MPHNSNDDDGGRTKNQRVVVDDIRNDMFEEEDSTTGTQSMNVVPDGVQRTAKPKKKEPEVLVNEDDEQDAQY